MKKLLWLDDKRNPFLDVEGRVPSNSTIDFYEIHWVVNYDQFVMWVHKYGLPEAVSFDHDLAPEHYTPEYFWKDYEESKKYQEWKKESYEEKTGADCARWLFACCDYNGLELPTVFIHSANPVGADFIRKELGMQLSGDAQKLEA